MIGVFTVPIGDLMLELKAERKEETEIIENICVELEKILQSGEFEVKSYNTSINNKGAKKQSTQNFDQDSRYESSTYGGVDTEIQRDAGMDVSEDGLIESERGSVTSSTKFKAKKRSGSRSKSGSKKIKKQIEKSLKDQVEVLGPNDEKGTEEAKRTTEEQLAIMKSLKATGIKDGGEDDGAQLFVSNRKLSDKN